jgi:predicted small secreted protein
MHKLLAATIAALALAGCNTVEGFGRDMSAAGGAISDAAHDTRTAKPSKSKHPAPKPCSHAPRSPGVC